MTNYEKIKAMSVEEMAEMLIEQKSYGVAHEEYLLCPDGTEFDGWDEKAMKKAIEHTKRWLESEVEEDG